MASPVAMEQSTPSSPSTIMGNDAAAQITHILQSTRPDITNAIRVTSAHRSQPLPPSKALAIPTSHRARVTYEIAPLPTQWLSLSQPGALSSEAHSLVFDELTSLAVSLDASHPHVWRALASARAHLNVAYVRPALEGDALTLTAEVVYVGTRRATVWGELRRKADGSLIALYENNKSAKASQL